MSKKGAEGRTPWAAAPPGPLPHLIAIPHGAHGCCWLAGVGRAPKLERARLRLAGAGWAGGAMAGGVRGARVGGAGLMPGRSMSSSEEHPACPDALGFLAHRSLAPQRSDHCLALRGAGPPQSALSAQALTRPACPRRPPGACGAVSITAVTPTKPARQEQLLRCHRRRLPVVCARRSGPLRLPADLLAPPALLCTLQRAPVSLQATQRSGMLQQHAGLARQLAPAWRHLAPAAVAGLHSSSAALQEAVLQTAPQRMSEVAEVVKEVMGEGSEVVPAVTPLPPAQLNFSDPREAFKVRPRNWPAGCCALQGPRRPLPLAG